jgi:hypothetical protein
MRNLKFLAAFALLCVFVYFAGHAQAASSPVTTPWPAPPPNGWCYRGPAPNVATDVTVTAGDCPAPPVSSCPAGRYTSGRVAYNYALTDYRQTDLTKADNIWGRNSAQGGQIDMPWLNYFAIFTHFPKDGYIAAQFTVPTDMVAAQWGMFSHGESLSGPNLTMSISERCGDFNPATAICLRSNIGPGGVLTKWSLPTATSVAACDVVPGRTYYTNIKMTAPPATHRDCTGASCKVTVQHNHTP